MNYCFYTYSGFCVFFLNGNIIACQLALGPHLGFCEYGFEFYYFLTSANLEHVFSKNMCRPNMTHT